MDDALAAAISWVGGEADACLGSGFRKIYSELDPQTNFASLSESLGEQLGEAWLAAGAIKEAMALDLDAVFGCAVMEGVTLAALSERLVKWFERLEYVLAAHQALPSFRERWDDSRLMSVNPLQNEDAAWKQIQALASWVSGKCAGSCDLGFRRASNTLEQFDSLIAPLDGNLSEARHRFDAIHGGAEHGRQAFGDSWRGEDSEWEKLAEVIKWVDCEAEVGLGGEIRRMFPELDVTVDFTSQTALLSERLGEARFAAEALKDEVKWNLLAAFGCVSLDNVPFALLDERLAQWHEHLESLTHWNTWFWRANRARRFGLSPIVEAMETGRLPNHAAVDVFDRGYFSRLLREAVRIKPELVQFN